MLGCGARYTTQLKKAPAPVLAEEAQLAPPQWWVGSGEQRAMLLLVSQTEYVHGIGF